MTKIFEARDKTEMAELVKLISNASYTLKGYEVAGANLSFNWLQSLNSRIHKHAEQDLFLKEDFEVKITKIPDPEPIKAPEPAEVPPAEEPIKKPKRTFKSA